jgi:hypothetical protein
MINGAFKKLKNNLELNESFDRIVQQKHKAVRSVIENIDLNIDTKLIGSLQRQTKIKPINGQDFDIDILVVLGSFYGWVSVGGISPANALQNIHGYINESERYNSLNPQEDSPTITFEYKDGIKVELVPAYKDYIGYSPDGEATEKGRGYWIPRDGKWVLADYDHEANHLTTMNNVSNGNLIPTIKMLKVLKNLHFPDLNSFHLEILAAQSIPGIVYYNNSRNTPNNYNNLIKDFFLIAKNQLHLPVKMGDSNSPLINLRPVDLEKIKNAFNTIHNYCETIENYTSEEERVKGWKTLFGNAMLLN